METFSGIKVAFNPKDAHTFGCSVYVLDNDLQQGRKMEKSTRPDIEYAVHMCARFSAEPRQPHAQSVK